MKSIIRRLHQTVHWNSNTENIFLTQRRHASIIAAEATNAKNKCTNIVHVMQYIGSDNLVALFILKTSLICKHGFIDFNKVIFSNLGLFSSVFLNKIYPEYLLLCKISVCVLSLRVDLCVFSHLVLLLGWGVCGGVICQIDIHPEVDKEERVSSRKSRIWQRHHGWPFKRDLFQEYQGDIEQAMAKNN